MLNNNAHVSPDVPEDVSMHEPLTMEQFNSPLVDSQYKSTYAVVANSGTYSHKSLIKKKIASLYHGKLSPPKKSVIITQGRV